LDGLRAPFVNRTLELKQLVKYECIYVCNEQTSGCFVKATLGELLLYKFNPSDSRVIASIVGNGFSLELGMMHILNRNFQSTHDTTFFLFDDSYIYIFLKLTCYGFNLIRFYDHTNRIRIKTDACQGERGSRKNPCGMLDLLVIAI
jgi:hypothetical protein